MGNNRSELFNVSFTKGVFLDTLKQGVSYSEKFRGKLSFPNLSNSGTSQLMFPNTA